MDYVDFVERVIQTYVKAQKPRVLLGWREIITELGLPENNEAVFHAVEDLREMGIVDGEGAFWMKPTESTEKIKAGRTLRDIWPTFVDMFLSDDQRTFLREIVSQSQHPDDNAPDVDEVMALDVLAALGWTTEDHDPHELADALKSKGLIRSVEASGYYIRMRPTYGGVVLITRQVETQWQTRLRGLLAEGETTTVDMKRQLSIGSEREKAEFVRDVLGLGTTKASGMERHMVVGFDNDTLSFIQSIDPEISRDRLEQVLNAYANPRPEIDWVPVPMAGGTAGVLVVKRDATNVPYRLSRDVWKLKKDGVYVRHGTHTEAPTEQELADLVAEGDRARARAESGSLS